MIGDVATVIKDFIASNFVMGNRERVAESESLMEAGLMDSTGVLELTAFLEEQFGIEVKDNELVPENLDSVANIVRYITRKTTETGPVS